MFSIRQATTQDFQGIQQANLANLPENYSLKYLLYHAISWPQGSYVATMTVGGQERIVGYVLTKMEDDNTDLPPDSPPAAHVTSVSVMRTYRKLGIAGALLRQSLRSMRESYGAESVSLHVRESNKAALHLYQKTLGFEVLEISAGYYADNEDAYSMKKVLDDSLIDSIPDDQDDLLVDGLDVGDLKVDN